VAKNGPS